MKKLSLILIIFSMLFISCSKDDDNGGSQAEITGTWELNKYEIDGEGTIEIDGEQIPVIIEGYGDNYNAQLTFADDTEPGIVTGSGTFDLTINFIFMGQIINTVEETISFEEMFLDATWIFNQASGTLTIQEGTSTPTVLYVTTLNNNTLVLEYTEIDEETSTNVTVKITLVR